MALSAAVQSHLAKFRQEPVQVVIDPDGTAVEFYLENGIDMTFVAGMEEQRSDLVGVWDMVTGGDGVTFDATFPEVSEDVLDVIYAAGLSGTAQRGFGRAAGYSMRAMAKKWQIRPWHTKDSSALQVVLWKVVPAGDIVMRMRNGEPYAFTVPFRALPDATQTDGEMVARISAPARS